MRALADSGRGGAARDAALLVLLTAPLLLAGLANHGFWRPDEPFVAEVSREMARSGDWVIPRLNGRPFLEKPPLHYAAVALAMKALGPTPLAARLPSLLGGFVTILATWAIGLRLFDRATALFAAAMLPASLLFFYTMHCCLVDSTLLPLVTIGFLGACFALGEDRRAWAIPLMWAAAALAFGTKGIVGPGLILMAFAAAAAVRREWSALLSPLHLIGLALFAAITGAWLAGAWRAGGGSFLREILVANTVGRFLGLPGLQPAGDRPGLHAHGPWVYLAGLPAVFLPWTPALLLAAPPGSRRLDRGEKIVWSFLLPGFLALIAAAAKRNIYLMPLQPLLALLAARQLAPRPGAAAAGEAAPWRRFLTWAQAAVVIGMSAAVPVIYLVQTPPGGAAGAGPLRIAAAALLALPAAAGAFAIARSRRGIGSPWLFPALWAQAALSLVLFATFCLPPLDAERGFGPFFREAARIEKERGATPWILSTHESFIGLAGLSFDRTLPVLRLSGGAGEDPPDGPVDVLTTERGFRKLSSWPGARCEVLFRWDSGAEYPFTTLYLLACAVAAPAGGLSELPDRPEGGQPRLP